MKQTILVLILNVMVSSCYRIRPANPTLTSNMNCRNHQTNLGLPLELSKLEYRIEGGTNTTSREFPWMAGVYSVKNKKEHFQGGASIITSRHLLTVAHVVVDEDGSDMHSSKVVARVGSNFKYRGLPLHVQSICIHPKYEGKEDDIAIIRLTSEIPFSDAIRPISLPNVNEKLFNYQGQMLTTAGWGYTSEKWDDTRILKKGKIHIETEEICLKKAPENYAHIQNYICGGDKGGSRACKGDSGGPLMAQIGGNVVVVALVDFIMGPETVCGKPDTPSYFIRVAPYLEWIHNVISVA